MRSLMKLHIIDKGKRIIDLRERDINEFRRLTIGLEMLLMLILISSIYGVYLGFSENNPFFIISVLAAGISVIIMFFIYMGYKHEFETGQKVYYESDTYEVKNIVRNTEGHEIVTIIDEGIEYQFQNTEPGSIKIGDQVQFRSWDMVGTSFTPRMNQITSGASMGTILINGTSHPKLY